MDKNVSLDCLVSGDSSSRLLGLELYNLLVVANSNVNLQDVVVLDSCKRLFIGYKTNLRHNFDSNDWPLLYTKVCSELYDFRKKVE